MRTLVRLGTSAVGLVGSLLLGSACGEDASPTPTPPEREQAPVMPAAAPAMPPATSGDGMPAGGAQSPPAMTPPVSGNPAQPGEGNMGPVGVAGGMGQTPSGGGNGNGVAPDAGTPGSTTPPEPPEPAAFNPCPSDGTPCRILPLGDSITFGVGSTGGGYRVELFRQAVEDGRNITFVGTAPPNGPTNVAGQPFPRAHQGHSGFTISGGGAGSLAGLVDASIAASDPDIVLLMIGTNDINQNINVAQAPARLEALLDQIITLAPDALLVVAEIVPTTNTMTNQRVLAYNAAIPPLIVERVTAGRHVVLVNMFTPFISNQNFATQFMDDFLHPNDAGYVVMAQTWYDAIEDLLPAR